ncbi:MAG: peptidylprolyl isomerase, partial [Bacillota bacterium]|nr:peptidylprolyl isomerase [Bacillota bacterium]
LQEEYFSDSEDSLNEALSHYKLTMKELESYLTETLEVYKLREEMGSAIVVPDAEAELFYQAHSEEFNIPEMIRVSHILVTDLKLAEQLVAQLKSGKDFAELASQQSIDTISAAVGGDLNWRTRGEFLPEFDDAAWALSKAGQLSDIVTTTHGYHIIRLDERLGARDRSYAEVEESVKEHLREELEAKMWGTYLDELRTRSRIFIFIK